MTSFKKYHLSIQALAVQQRPPEYAGVKEFLNECDFFVFTLSLKDMLEIAKFSPRLEGLLLQTILFSPTL
jgi:hypothetical protein